jgi:hypothetical protein
MKLVFLDLEFHKPDHRSMSGGGWIVPKQHSTGSNGAVHLTPHCAGLGEVEWHIDRLQAELEEIRKRARKKFAAVADRGGPSN